MTLRNGRRDRTGDGVSTKRRISATHRNVCLNMKELRTQMGYSQSYMASKLGMAQPSYAAMETARCDLRLETIEKIAKVLGQPVAVLFARRPIYKKG